MANNAGNGEKRRCEEGSVASEDKSHNNTSISSQYFYVELLIYTVFSLESKESRVSRVIYNSHEN